VRLLDGMIAVKLDLWLTYCSGQRSDFEGRAQVLFAVNIAASVLALIIHELVVNSYSCLLYRMKFDG